MNFTPRSTASVLSNVRATCALVARDALLVHIDEESVEDLGRRLSSFDLARPRYDVIHHFDGPEHILLSYVMTLGAMNCGSGYRDEIPFLIENSVYYTLAGALKAWYNSGRVFSASDLAYFSTDQMLELLGVETCPLDLRAFCSDLAATIRPFGRYICDAHSGSYEHFVQAAEGSAESFVEMICGLAPFNDTSMYKGMTVCFYKKAQLLVWDLNLAFRNGGAGCFNDLEKLSIFADNLVPYVLHREGVLKYSPSLSSLLENGDLLTHGEPSEVEIRACALHASELICAVVRKSCPAFRAVDLDFFLWNLGHHGTARLASNKGSCRHFSRTIFY